MTEWLKVAVLKTAVPATVPWVRIPLSPPVQMPVSSEAGFCIGESDRYSNLKGEECQWHSE